MNHSGPESCDGEGGESNWPHITVVIPILDEAATLRPTLEAIARQDYPTHLFEVLVVDGGSRDDWRSVVASVDLGPVQLRTLPNPRRTVPAAINLALESTAAEAVLWISGHCVLSPDYVAAAARAFRESPHRVIGGRLRVQGKGVIGRLNAMLLSSRFGTGVASLRFGNEIGPTRSVTFAVYARDDLVRVGGLDERLWRNQDNDVQDRLRQAGVEFRRVDAVATYLAPRTLMGLWRRAWNNGAWNIWCRRAHRGGQSWWHFVPMATVGGGALLLLGAIWWEIPRYTLFGLVTIYLALAALSAAITGIADRAFWAIPVLPIWFLLHHAVYGLGSWSAVLRPIPEADGLTAQTTAALDS